MLRLRRLLLDSVGTTAARFANVLLNFTDDDGRPLDSIMWSRNGAGKTSMLALFFSLLLPNQRDFLGERVDGRALADYVLTGDTAHVVAEWQTHWGRLVTGAVYEWPERRRPSDYTKRQGELHRRWYVFTPVDGVLTLEGLPIRMGGQRALLGDFTAELKRLGREHPRLELSHATTAHDWTVALRERSIDPGVFRYQKDMNRAEAAIDERFRFSSDEAFIDFLVDLVIDEEAPESVARRMRTLAGKLSNRKPLTAELSYCEGVTERLGPLQATWTELDQRRAAQRQVAAAGARLAAELTAGHKVAATAAATAVGIAKAAGAQLSEATTDRLAARNTALEYRRLGANLWVQEVTDKLRAARAARDAAALDEQAWQAVELLLAIERRQAEIDDIDQQVTATAAKAEPARQRRNDAACRLRARLVRLTEEAETARRHASKLEAEQTARAEAAAKEARRLGELAAQAETEHGLLDEQLAGQLTARDQTVTDGHLLAGEPPADGLARARARDRDLAAAASRLDTELRGKQARQAQLVGDHSTVDTARSTAEQQRETAADEAAKLRAEADALAATERLRELAQTTTLSVWAAGTSLQYRLSEEIAQAARRMAEETAQTHHDERAASALGDQRQGPDDNRLLPPSEDTEAVLALLAEENISATPGLAFLAQSVRREDWPAMIRAHPGLLSGVLVDPGEDYNTAVRVLTRTDLLPASLVTVAPKTAILETIGGEQAFVVPPAPALVDPEQTDSERARLAERLEDAAGRLAAIQAVQAADQHLLQQLRNLLGRCPVGHLEELDRRAADHEARAAAARARLAELEAERDELATWLRQAPERQRALGEQRLAVGRTIAVLEPLADAFAGRATLEEQRDETVARATTARSNVAEQTRAETAARTAAGAAHDRVQALDRYLQDLADRLAGVTLVSDDPDKSALPADDPVVATEVLTETFRRLDEAYWGQADTAVLADRRRRAEQDLRAATEQLARHRHDVQARAAVLRARPAASDPTLRADAHTQARDDHRRLLGEVAVREAELKRAEAEQTASAPPRGKVFRVLAVHEQPTDRADALARQQAAEQTAQQHQETATKAKEQHDAADAEHRRLTELADKLNLLAAGLTDPLAALTVAIPSVTDVPAYQGSFEDAHAAQEALVKQLRANRRQVDQARTQLQGLHAQLRDFAKPYAHIGALREVVMDDDAETVGADAQRLADQHRERVAVLRESLAAIAEDQQILVGDLTGQVRDLIDLLASANTLRMPDGLGAWRGKPFLTITFEDPTTDEAELRRRVSEQVDAIIDRGGSLPEGIATLKQALHAAVPKGFRARLLKPTVDLAEERVSVTIMGKWSGGEKLTAAVALYCTMARLRAGTRAKTLGADSGALILDNPLGKSSYVGFVNLQRRIAAFLDVQLIYTTAVRDLKAVGRFPNVLRCRNVRRPGQTRSFLVVAERLGDAHGTPITGTVATARVVRTDYPSIGNGHPDPAAGDADT